MTTQATPHSETLNGADTTTSETLVTPQETGETPETSKTSAEDAQKELDSLKAALKKANAEAASHRIKAKELDELKEKIEAEKLSETEKLQKQIAKLQNDHDNAIRSHQERIINYEVRLQAASMGIIDPDAAARLLDWSEIEYDDSGRPTNINDLLEKLKKAKPYLAGKASQVVSTSGGATNPSRSQSAVQALSWDVITKLSPEEYSARRVEIQQWMAQNPMRFGQRLSR